MEHRKPSRTISLFVPEEFFDTLSMFEKLITIDTSINKDNVKNKHKLVSIKIRHLITTYVDKHRNKIIQNE